MEFLQLGKNINVDEHTSITINGEKINIKKFLTPLEKYAFIRIVVETAFDFNTGRYDALLADILFEVFFVHYMTDVNITEDYQSGDLLFTAALICEKSGLSKMLKEARSEAYTELQEMKKLHETSILAQQRSFTQLGVMLGGALEMPTDEVLAKFEDGEFHDKVEGLSNLFNKV